MKCKKCKKSINHYDYVKRNIRIENGEKIKILVERQYCKECKYYKRILPEYVLPYKHYRKDIIYGFITNKLNGNMLEYEDYPSESTIKRWKMHEKYIYYNERNFIS